MKIKPLHILLGLILALFIIMEIFGPKPQNWDPNYSNVGKMPFGSYLLFEQLPDLFPENQIEVVEVPPVDFLASYQGAGSNYIILQEQFETEAYEASKLMDFARKGNNLFIATSKMSGDLIDSLGVIYSGELGAMFSDSTDKLGFIRELDPNQQDYPLIPNYSYSYFVGFDGERMGYNADGEVVFGRIPVGAGWVYLHSIPMVFTNYYMVDSLGESYISRALSALPAGITFWDEYYKPNRIRLRTPLRYVLQEKGLKWAWILGLVTILLFVLFRGKRKQRIIPEIKAPVNSTLEFAGIIGALYHSNADHRDILKKKIKFFHEHIRTQFNLPTKNRDPEFVRKLAQKSGLKVDFVQELIRKTDNIENHASITEELLMDIHNSIEEFYQKSK